MKKTYLVTSIILLLVILIFYNEINPNHNFKYYGEQEYTGTPGGSSGTISEFIRYEPYLEKSLVSGLLKKSERVLKNWKH